MMSKNQKMTTSEFYCTKCGNRGIPIARRVGRERGSGHLKRLYCIHCKREWNFAEVRPFGEYNYDDFLTEFRYGNFNYKGNRIIGYKQFLAKLRHENLKQERCQINE